MGKITKFKDHMKRSFIKYAAALILLMFVLFVAFILLNFQVFIVKANENCNKLVSDFVSGQYSLYVKNIEVLADNKEIKKVLAQNGNLTEVNRLLYEFCLGQEIESNFALLRVDGSIVASNLYKTNKMLLVENSNVKDVLTRLQSDPGATYCVASRIPFDNGQKADFLFARTVQRTNGDILGYLLFDLREDSLSKFMRNKDADIIVTDRLDHVIFSTNSLIIDSMGKYKLDWAGENTATIDGKPYYVTSSTLPEGGMKVLTLTSIASHKQLLEFGIIFLCGISLFLIILVIILADKVMTKNLSSIDELLHAVSECREGNIDYRIKSQTFDEFQTLYDEFNGMMVKLQILIKNNTELIERKHWMEVKHLEEQFKPHFVFNVLETLRYEMLLDPAKASQMVVSFANLMRYSINYGSAHVPLQTDIEYIKDYLVLQKMRYNKRLEYSINMEEALLQCKVPKLLIQPIVENSVVHGLEMTKCLTVMITGRAFENNLELCVEDDGQGMTPKQLDVLRALLEDENAMPEHIGLYNVHRVAKLLYGEGYGLTIESICGKGTKVLVKIPLTVEAKNV